MPQSSLNPGDRVIELAALAASAGTVAGAVTGAWILRLVVESWIAAAAGLCGGAAYGYLLGRRVGTDLYRTAEGLTTVVKVGRESFRSTIPAGLAGGLAASLSIALLAVLVHGGAGSAGELFGIAILCGCVLGGAVACLSSML
jgi:hypothetical protein